MLADTSNKKRKRFKLIIIIFYGFLLLFCAVTYISDKLATGVFASSPIDLSKPSEVTLDYFIWFPGEYSLDIVFHKKSRGDSKFINIRIPSQKSECDKNESKCVKYKFVWQIYKTNKLITAGVKEADKAFRQVGYGNQEVYNRIVKLHLPFGTQQIKLNYLGGLRDFTRFSPEIMLYGGNIKWSQSNLAGLLMWGNVFAMLFIWPFLVLSLIVNNIIWLYKMSKKRKNRES